jgi:hypothetical protein
VGYDPNGSGDVTSYNDGTKTHQYVYVGENRLLSVDGSNGLDPANLAATAAGAAAASSIITEVLEAIGASALAF